jgi:hypothetical protein
MKDRELRLYERALRAGVGSPVDCRPNEWRDAQALVCQGLIQLVGERSPHGFFAVCARSWNIPSEVEMSGSRGSEK